MQIFVPRRTKKQQTNKQLISMVNYVYAFTLSLKCQMQCASHRIRVADENFDEHTLPAPRAPVHRVRRIKEKWKK